MTVKELHIEHAAQLAINKIYQITKEYYDSVKPYRDGDNIDVIYKVESAIIDMEKLIASYGK